MACVDVRWALSAAISDVSVQFDLVSPGWVTDRNGQRTLSNLPRVGFGTCAAWWLGMSEAPGRRVIAWLNSSDRELRVPSCSAGMTVSNRALIMLSDALRHRRTQLGTRWRRLDAGQQALLVVAHLRTVRATDAGHEQLVAWARRECR
ncbi:MAG: transposase, partial [Pseudonocardia sp.]|nr:transposase [Pseudonocardia sp.]